MYKYVYMYRHTIETKAFKLFGRRHVLHFSFGGAAGPNQPTSLSVSFAYKACKVSYH